MKTVKNVTTMRANQRANILNNNKGTPGANIDNAKMHGNRGKQLNPNNRVQERAGRLGQRASQHQDK